MKKLPTDLFAKIINTGNCGEIFDHCERISKGTKRICRTEKAALRVVHMATRNSVSEFFARLSMMNEWGILPLDFDQDYYPDQGRLDQLWNSEIGDVPYDNLKALCRHIVTVKGQLRAYIQQYANPEFRDAALAFLNRKTPPGDIQRFPTYDDLKTYYRQQLIQQATLTPAEMDIYALLRIPRRRDDDDDDDDDA